jgi:hypothetical protein
MLVEVIWIHCYVTQNEEVFNWSTLKYKKCYSLFCLDIHHVGMNASFLRANIFWHLLCYGVDYDNHIQNCDKFYLKATAAMQTSLR